MLRTNPAASMQKTYDEAYLTCSTAIYFEKQNNEEQALRSWREALDQIYYHNAYKVPAHWRPKSETEKALQESLRQMELQCKERVDLLDALRQSRSDSKSRTRSNDSSATNGAARPAPAAAAAAPPAPPPVPARSARASPRPPPYPLSPSHSYLGQGTVPTADYSDIARPRSAQSVNIPPRQPSSSSITTAPTMPPPPSLKPPPKKTSRSPSPDKKNSMLKTTLRPDKKQNGKSTNSNLPATVRPARTPKSAAQAATLAWPGGLQPSGNSGNSGPTNASSSSLASQINNNVSRTSSLDLNRSTTNNLDRKPSVPSSPDSFAPPERRPQTREFVARQQPQENPSWQSNSGPPASISRANYPKKNPPPPPPGPRRRPTNPPGDPFQDASQEPIMAPPPPDFPTYRKEYPTPTPIDPKKVQGIAKNPPSQEALDAPQVPLSRSPRPPVHRKAVASGDLRPTSSRKNSTDVEERKSNQPDAKSQDERLVAELPSEDVDSPRNAELAWEARVEHLMKNLPRGVDEQASQAIFNEIVIKGDEVHWDDISGLDHAKNALKEAVVYPFLRPDLFMGLREPARGMLLFGPPGTGKTMLARAVATESKSTFFAISASSLTSKFLGESEKLVRALFAIARALAPSIIFVDEIDSLLSARAGSGEHEATRRIKTEFLIQWSDLQKAAAGREQSDKEKLQGDATRVLVLAATNLPWAIDEAARRRFVRRQYIPLPEDPVRGEQLQRLLSAQKHGLGDADISELVSLTDGFSGSDITALAKDAAMGPLRSLGEELLHMSPDQIRPIMFQDFEASLVNIRPSVSRQGLKEYEDWAKEFGERGG